MNSKTFFFISQKIFEKRSCPWVFAQTLSTVTENRNIVVRVVVWLLGIGGLRTVHVAGKHVRQNGLVNREHVVQRPGVDHGMAEEIAFSLMQFHVRFQLILA